MDEYYEETLGADEADMHAPERKRVPFGPAPPPQAVFDATKVIEASKFVPLRLTEEERKLLKVLENALDVSEYTDNVDVVYSYQHKRKHARILEGLLDILSTLSGLLVATDLMAGEKTVKGKGLEDNLPLFVKMFEVGRRHKIACPDRLRDTYGKLMWMLMDTASDGVQRDLNHDFVAPIQTVYRFLKARGASAMEILQDPLILIATRVVDVPTSFLTGSDSGSAADLKITEKLRAKQQQQVREKQEAANELVRKYAIPRPKSQSQSPSQGKTESENQKKSATTTAPSEPCLSESEVRRVIDSLADNETFIMSNAGPPARILRLLRDNFGRDNEEAPFGLTLRHHAPKAKFTGLFGGYSSSYFGAGAALAHSHREQFDFVEQSVALWEEIMRNMPRLWLLADSDMLLEGYRLMDTGQGYHRVQHCPRVAREMSAILRRVQSRFRNWVGLSVVHLGDRDVPNALVFIDKYTQVPKILAPIAQAIEKLSFGADSQETAFEAYVKAEWGSFQGLRMQIMSDFFKHGFDGSGDDGGSCIDGRLTSAWNWCSKLEKKPYYHAFMFTGFQGFDGRFD